MTEQEIQAVIALAEAHGLSIRPETLRWNESGLDFRVALVEDAAGQRWVLRVPRREDSTRSLERERRALELVRGRLSVEAPVWEVATHALIAYRALAGVPSATIDPEAKAYVWALDPAAVPAAHTDTLARALASLHSIPIEDAARAGMEPLVGSLGAARWAEVEQVSAAFTVAPSLLDRWRRWCEDATLWPPAPAVIHGDLHAGHVLIDDAQRVTGLIDWTEARIGDPALDLMSYRLQYGDAAQDALIEAYGRAGGQVWPRLKEHLAEREAAFAIDVGLFALRSGREDMRELAIQLLGAG